MRKITQFCLGAEIDMIAKVNVPDLMGLLPH
jgi:hypothetical protein